MIKIHLDSIPEHVPLKGYAETCEVYMDGKLLTPEMSLRLRDHSPDGFAWGYCGSGPSQLALAILLHYIPVEDALKLYHSFKEKFISTLQGDQDFETVIPLRGILNVITANYNETHH